MTGDTTNREADADAGGTDPVDRTDEEWAEFLNSPRRRLTFSLRTMFFLVTCVAVFFCGARVAGPDGGPIVLASLFLSFFLGVWSSVRPFPVRARVFFMLSILFFVLDAPNFFERGHRAARELVCGNNLAEIGRALTLYHKNHGSFPPAFVADQNGKPLVSWRALILPELGMAPSNPLVRPREPWSGPNNRSVAAVALFHFHCPKDDQPMQMASYLAVVGPHAAWSGGQQPRKLADFKDPARTIMVIEMPNSGVNWLEPRDVFVGQLKEGLGAIISSSASPPHPHGFNVLFADGHIETLPADIDPKVLATMLDIDPANATKK